MNEESLPHSDIKQSLSSTRD